jgi:four helix bundle protein
MSFKFEKLIVWQKAVELSGEIEELTAQFPQKEIFVLTSQMKRAADSIALNIAEGSTGQTSREFKRFLGIALRSAIELVCCLYIGQRRKLISQEKFDYFYKSINDLVKGTQALRKSLA